MSLEQKIGQYLGLTIDGNINESDEAILRDTVETLVRNGHREDTLMIKSLNRVADKLKEIRERELHHSQTLVGVIEAKINEAKKGRHYKIVEDLRAELLEAERLIDSMQYALANSDFVEAERLGKYYDKKMKEYVK